MHCSTSFEQPVIRADSVTRGTRETCSSRPVNRQALRLDAAGMIDLNRDELLTLTRTDIDEAARLV